MNEEFEGRIADPEGAAFGVDPLLQCLVLFTQLYHKPYSAEALMAGLPSAPWGGALRLYSLKSSKRLFSRAASRAGLKSTLIHRKLSDISPLQLPMILLLENSNACILDSISADRKTCKIILPAEEAIEENVPCEILDSEYVGFAFLIKKPFIYNENDSLTLNVKHKHWFWDTLKLSKSIARVNFKNVSSTYTTNTPIANTHNVSVALFGMTRSYTLIVKRGLANTKRFTKTVAYMTSR